MLQCREWGWHFYNGSTNTWNAWFGKHCLNKIYTMIDWLICIHMKKNYIDLWNSVVVYFYKKRNWNSLKVKTRTSSIFASWLLFWSREKYRYEIPCKALYCVNLFYPSPMNLWPLGTLWWPLELWDKFCFLKVNKSTKWMLWMSSLQIYCHASIFLLS